MKKLMCLMALQAAALAAEAAAHTATFMTNRKDPLVIKTTGRLVMPHPGDYNGRMFVGWRDAKDKSLHAKWEVVTLTGDAQYRPEYKEVDFTDLVAGSDAKPTAHLTGKGIFYAVGDSITFGTKVGGNAGAWPRFVAERLGMTCVNDARAGSRLSAWRSVLTQSVNHNQCLDTHAGGVVRDQMLDGIRRAGVIGFTLGTNDLLYNNKGEDVAKRMLEFAEALHHYNPQALVIAVGGANSEAFRAGGKYAKSGPDGAKLNELLGKALNGPKYRDWCLYVDITDIFADHASYENCERAPDGVHPGRDGQKKIAEKVLRYVKPCAGVAETPKLAAIVESETPDSDPLVKMPTRAEMWNLADAGRVKTAVREKVSLNGLWAIAADGTDDLAKAPLFRGISNADIQWNYPSCIATLARFDEGKVLRAFHVGAGAIVFSSVSQGTFDEKEINLRHNRRRAQGLVTRLVANLGGSVDEGFLKRAGSLYADKPEQNDDPYRYYRW